MGWWRFTRSAIEALTRPPADVDACDRAVRDLARDSRIGAALRWLGRMVSEAWEESGARAAAFAIARALAPESDAQTFRLRGLIVVVAGATTLSLNALKPVPVGPLSSLVPSLAIGAGALLILMAAPVARASADRRSRHKAS